MSYAVDLPEACPYRGRPLISATNNNLEVQLLEVEYRDMPDYGVEYPRFLDAPWVGPSA
jgi:hypothetical protein